MKRKGFTLIELLAVIVVLAIIAVIATPIVLNIVESARKGAFESTLSNVKDAAQYYQSRVELDESLDECRYFSFTNDVQVETIIDGKLYVPVKKLDLKGSLPTVGEVEVCPENIAIEVSDGSYSGVVDGDTSIVVKGDDVSIGDKVPATIRRINAETTATTIHVTVDAYSGKYGKIKKYEYSLNDKKHYVESNETYVFENLDFDTEYTIYVRVTTTSGVVTEGSIKARTEYALLSVTANGYTGIYDGTAHGITVSSNGATIKYGTSSGTYNLTSSPTYTDVGTYTVYYQVTRTGYKTVTGSKTIIITKANGSITLSDTSGSYTYPTTGTFTVTKNISGGALSCSSSNTNIATCKVSGTTITVTPGTTPGIATLTITSAGTDNYNEASTTYTATTASGILSVTANEYTGVYDGYAHGITVSSNGATIKYGEKEGTYNLTKSPTYTDAGIYTVYYQVSKIGYKTVTGSKTVTITKADGNVTLSANSGTLTYPTATTITVAKNISGGALSCSSSNTKIATCTVSGNILTVTPLNTPGTATITVTSATTMNYNEAFTTYTVTTVGQLSVTANGYTGTYDGKAHGISVTSSGSTIKYGTSSGTYNLTSSPTYINAGTYVVYYQVSRTGYKTVTGSKTVTINKANGDVNLSANSGTITYPTPTMITVTKNISGGTLSCSSSNKNVATCSVTGTRLDIYPGTTAGVATITVTSAATTNYNAASAAYTATTVSGTLSVTANGYSGTYDGKAHGISVTSSGATIKYGTSSGTYNLTSSPTYTNAGTYTVYYQVSKTGYKTVTGSKTVTISKASGTLTLSSSSVSITGGNSTSVTASNYKGTLSCSSNNPSIVGCSVSGATIKVSTAPSSSTSLTITVKSAATTNYTKTSKTLLVYISGPVAYNTVNGVTTYYTTAKTAFDASTTGTTTLIANTSENISTKSTTNKTLNLNGKTLTGVIINNQTGASLTINGSGTITNSKDRVIYNAGTMNINNVTLSGSYTGFSESIYNTSTGNMTFTDCTLYTGTTYKINNDNANSFIKMIRSFNTDNIFDKMKGKFVGHGVSGNGNYEVSIKGGGVITHCPTRIVGQDGSQAIWHTASKYAGYYYCQFSKTTYAIKSLYTDFYNRYLVCGANKNQWIAGFGYSVK